VSESLNRNHPGARKAKNLNQSLGPKNYQGRRWTVDILHGESPNLRGPSDHVKLARWLATGGTHHLGAEDQRESLITFYSSRQISSGFRGSWVWKADQFLGRSKSRVTRYKAGDPGHWISAAGEPLDQPPTSYHVSGFRGV
jgi:hypothetical protein